jgi:hypothetical protein
MLIRCQTLCLKTKEISALVDSHSRKDSQCMKNPVPVGSGKNQDGIVGIIKLRTLTWSVGWEDIVQKGL